MQRSLGKKNYRFKNWAVKPLANSRPECPRSCRRHRCKSLCDRSHPSRKEAVLPVSKISFGGITRLMCKFQILVVQLSSACRKFVIWYSFQSVGYSRGCSLVICQTPASMKDSFCPQYTPDRYCHCPMKKGISPKLSNRPHSYRVYSSPASLVAMEMTSSSLSTGMSRLTPAVVRINSTALAY